VSMQVPPPDADGAAAAVEVDAAVAVGDDVIGEAGPITGPVYDMRGERRQAARERRRLLLRRPGFIIGVLIILTWIVCGVGGDKITPSDPLVPTDTSSLSPRAGHLMGTDQLGRDVLSRVMAGARDVLIVAPLAATLSIIAGAFLGLLMGYYRGWVDEILSRLVEVLLSIPVILMALLITATLGSSKIVVIGTVAVPSGLTNVPRMLLRRSLWLMSCSQTISHRLPTPMTAVATVNRLATTRTGAGSSGVPSPAIRCRCG